MRTDTIKAVFTNILFVIGVGFAIFGFIRGTSTITRSVIFERYPLQTWEETRCTDQFGTSVIEMKPDAVPTLTPEEKTAAQVKCQAEVNRQRQIRKTEDIVLSVSTLVVGLILIFSFRRFIFAKAEK